MWLIFLQLGYDYGILSVGREFSIIADWVILTIWTMVFIIERASGDRFDKT